MRFLFSAGCARLALRLTAVIPAILFSLAAGAAESGTTAQRYIDYCSVCHGDRGQGARHAQQGMMPPPQDFTDPAFARTMQREDIIAAIRDGKPGTAMIAWKSELREEEIVELADYIIDNFISGAGAKSADDRVGPDIHEVTKIYQESCSVCHGDDGTGAVWGQESLSSAPRDFTSQSARLELTRDRMIASVTYGRPGSPMPGFGTQLSPAQIEAIVDYIRTTFMSEPADERNKRVALGSYHEQPFPNGLTGHFERGRAFYMGNCVTCHGIEGAGDGPRAYFIFPRPRSFLDAATQQILNRSRLFNGIKDGVIGREMPAWGKVMDDQDVADIAEYVYLEFILGERETD